MYSQFKAKVLPIRPRHQRSHSIESGVGGRLKAGRFLIRAPWVCVLFGANAFAAAPLQAQESIHVQAQDLGEALKAIGIASDEQILFSKEIVNGKQSGQVDGEYSADDALALLLNGSGLSAERTPSGVILIRATASTTKSHPDAAGSGEAGYSALNTEGSRSPVLLAQTADQRSQPASSQSSSSLAESSTRSDDQVVEEVIVTAQKQGNQRLRDVPVSVTAIQAIDLAQKGQVRLQDYFASVPGLNFATGGPVAASSTISIRGLASGGITGPTVGLLIDDIPYGSSSGAGLGSLQNPDLDPSDVERIEVLRGPQGTLYGASSIGGMIRFVTVDPSTSELGGHLQMLGSSVRHGGTGYGLRGAVNFPVSDSLAIRASGFTRRDPGYVTNVTVSQDDVNEADGNGARVVALWNPSDALSVRIAAMSQEIDAEGDSGVDVDSVTLVPLVGDLKQARLRGTGRWSTRADLYSATLAMKVGDFDFISVSGYTKNKLYNFKQASPGFFSFAEQFFNVSGAGLGFDIQTEKFSQELRLQSPNGSKLEWMVGAFYTDENTSSVQPIEAVDPARGVPVSTLITFDYPTTFDEIAAFAALTVHFNDRFDVQFGGRQSENKQKYDETDTGPLNAIFYGDPAPFVFPTQRTKDNSFTYLVTPRFKVSPNVMVYTRFASGYRAGGPNFSATALGVPPQYDADMTESFEFGIKGDLLNRAVAFEVAGYYVDWKDLQLSLRDPATGLGYFGNAGKAESQGAEISLQMQPTDGLTVEAQASFNDASLAEDLPSNSTTFGVKGDRLPFSSRFSGSISVQKDLDFTSSVVGFVRGSAIYVGERIGEFVGPTQSRFRYPSFSQVDLQAGVRLDSWTANVFANNITDERGILGNQVSGSNFSVNYVQPRTVGVSLAYDF